MTNDTSFFEVTNADIYKAIKDLENKLGELQIRLEEQRSSVKIAQWLGTTALTLSLVAVSILLKK